MSRHHLLFVLILMAGVASCNAATSSVTPIAGEATRSGTTTDAVHTRHVKRTTGPSCNLIAPNPIHSPFPIYTTIPYQQKPSVPPGFTPGWMAHLHFPPGGKATNATIVFFQGGGLTALEPPDVPGQEMYTVANNLAQSLNALVVVPEYTIDPPAYAANPPEVVWASRDVGCAIAWVNQYAMTYFGGASKPLLVAGYSAGGQLAAMMGTQASTYIPTPNNLGGVAPLSGRYDFDVVPYGGVSAQGWVNLHGTGNSPIDYVSKTSYSWMLTYEQCDADTQYGNWARFSPRLQAQSNTVVNFEDNPYPPSCPAHGGGLAYLQTTGNAYYNEFAAFDKYVGGNGPLPPSTTGVEQIPPTTPNKSNIGFNDMAFGGDGSLWIIEGGTGDQPVAKYADVGNITGKAFYETASVSPSLAMNGTRIAVDGNGDPWVLKSDGTIQHLAGGFNGSGWAQISAPVAAIDVGAGGSFGAPYIWMVGTDGNVYAYGPHKNAFVFEPGPMGAAPGTRITVGSFAHAWLVDRNHNYYDRNIYGQWTKWPGMLVDIGGDYAIYGIGTDSSVYLIADGTAKKQSQMPQSIVAGGNALGQPASTNGTAMYQSH